MNHFILSIRWRYCITINILLVVFLFNSGRTSDLINQKSEIPGRQIDDIWKIGDNWDYIFLIAGKEVGHQENTLVERVETEVKPLFRFKHVFHFDTSPVNGKVIVDMQSESLVDELGHPHHYHANAKVNGVPQIVNIEFVNGSYKAIINIAGREQIMEGEYSPDAIILDNNIIGHMAFLFGTWELEVDMKMKKRCFIPSIFKEVEIDFAIVKREEHLLEDQTMEEVFTVEMPELNQIVQVSGRGMILGLQAPKQYLEVKLRK